MPTTSSSKRSAGWETERTRERAALIQSGKFRNTAGSQEIALGTRGKSGQTIARGVHERNGGKAQVTYDSVEVLNMVSS